MIYEEQVRKILFATMDSSNRSGTIHLNSHPVFPVQWIWMTDWSDENETTHLYPYFEEPHSHSAFWEWGIVPKDMLSEMVAEISSKLEKRLISTLIEEE